MGHVWPYTPCLRLLDRHCLSACCAAGWSPHGPTSGWLDGSYCRPCCCWCCSGLLPPHSGSAAAWAPQSQAGRGSPSPWCTTTAGGRQQRARSWQRRSFQYFSCLARTARLEETHWVLMRRPLLRVPDTTCREEMSNEFFPAVWVNKVEQITKYGRRCYSTNAGNTPSTKVINLMHTHKNMYLPSTKNIPYCLTMLSIGHLPLLLFWWDSVWQLWPFPKNWCSFFFWIWCNPKELPCNKLFLCFVFHLYRLSYY